MIENESNSRGGADGGHTLHCGLCRRHDGFRLPWETGFLYRFEDAELLAMQVCRLFGDMDLCRHVSSRGRRAALARHDRSANANN